MDKINSLNKSRSLEEEIAAVRSQGCVLTEMSNRINILRNKHLTALTKELTTCSGFATFIQQTAEAEALASSSVKLLEEDVELLEEKTKPVRNLNDTFAVFQQYIQNVKQLSNKEISSEHERAQALERADELELEIDRGKSILEKCKKEVAAIKERIAEQKEKKKAFSCFAEETKRQLILASQKSQPISQPVFHLTPESGAIVPFRSSKTPSWTKTSTLFFLLALTASNNTTGIRPDSPIQTEDSDLD